MKKCNTTKYRKRREKERKNSIVARERAAKEKQEYYARMDRERERQEKIRRQKKEEIRRLQNILVSRMFQLDPGETRDLMAWDWLHKVFTAVTGREFTFVTHFPEPDRIDQPDSSQSPDIFIPDISIEI